MMHRNHQIPSSFEFTSKRWMHAPNSFPVAGKPQQQLGPSRTIAYAATLQRPLGMIELKNIRDLQDLGMDTDLEDITIRDVKVSYPHMSQFQFMC
jgi:hypothetical protein